MMITLENLIAMGFSKEHASNVLAEYNENNEDDNKTENESEVKTYVEYN